MSGIQVGMSQPVADHINVVSCTQQVHGAGMPDGMWVDAFGSHIGLFYLCLSAVLAGDVSDAEASDGKIMKDEAGSNAPFTVTNIQPTLIEPNSEYDVYTLTLKSNVYTDLQQTY